MVASGVARSAEGWAGRATPQRRPRLRRPHRRRRRRLPPRRRRRQLPRHRRRRRRWRRRSSSRANPRPRCDRPHDPPPHPPPPHPTPPRMPPRPHRPMAARADRPGHRLRGRRPAATTLSWLIVPAPVADDRDAAGGSTRAEAMATSRRLRLRRQAPRPPLPRPPLPHRPPPPHRPPCQLLCLSLLILPTRTARRAGSGAVAA